MIKSVKSTYTKELVVKVSDIRQLSQDCERYLLGIKAGDRLRVSRKRSCTVTVKSHPSFHLSLRDIVSFQLYHQQRSLDHDPHGHT